MAKKKALQPREPQEEVELDEIDGDVTDAFGDLLGVPIRKPVVREEIVEPTESPPGFTNLDQYLKDQVLQEMYGTTTPSEYERISLAIKRKL